MMTRCLSEHIEGAFMKALHLLIDYMYIQI